MTTYRAKISYPKSRGYNRVYTAPVGSSKHAFRLLVTYLKEVLPTLSLKRLPKCTIEVNDGGAGWYTESYIIVPEIVKALQRGETPTQ